LILACDPGTKFCAFALYRDRKLIATYKIKSTFDKLREFFSSLKVKNYVFIIEDQYLSLNVRTLKLLVEVRTTVLTLARIYNASKCLVIPPQKWQRAMLGVSIKSKREQRKAVSCLVASSIAKRQIKDNDIADAICIGDYVNRRKVVTQLSIYERTVTPLPIYGRG